MRAVPLIQRLAIVAAVACAGCDALRAKPGDDFGVTLVGLPSFTGNGKTVVPLTVSGKITVPLRLSVTGCDAFDVALLGWPNGTPGQPGSARTNHPLEVVKEADGTFCGDAPVPWLVGAHCDLFSREIPTATLAVTCRDVGRTVEVELELLYSAANSTYLAYVGQPWVPSQVLFPSNDPFEPYVLSPSPSERWVWGDVTFKFPGWLDVEVVQAHPLARPRVAVAGDKVFFSTGCDPASPCPQVPVAAGTTVPGEGIWGTRVDREGWRIDGDTWSASVPGHVLDMASLSYDTIVVLSEVFDPSSPLASVATVVTRVLAVASAGPDATEVTVVGYFPGEHVRTGFSRAADGRLAFVSHVLPSGDGPLTSALHLTNGYAVVSRAAPTGALPLGEVSNGVLTSARGIVLSPDASALLVEGDGQTHLVTADGTATSLPVSGACLGTDACGATWFSGSVALWSGVSLWTDGRRHARDAGRVDVFDAAPPHALRYTYEVHAFPWSSTPAALYGVTSLGDKLVLTTSTGIRILGPDGAVVAGADPLPCGHAPNAVAIQSGPELAAVASGDAVFLFDPYGLGGTNGRAPVIIEVTTP